jgi:hypothetical protein
LNHQFWLQLLLKVRPWMSLPHFGKNWVSNN